jgi:pyruvate formate lyase activating enzyme
MKIKGIQKLTLVDYPGKLACTIFLFGCNFKCGFCHNPELVIGNDKGGYYEEEILDFLEKRKKYLDGVCITGGEPLLSLKDDFLKKIRSLGYLIKIDTNGSCPERLQWIIDKGLVDFISMDIKSSKEKYSEVVDCEIELDKIEESIKIISLFPNYEFRTTIVGGIHDAEELMKMMAWLNGVAGKLKEFSLQGFKNNGKFIDDSFSSKKDISEDYLIELSNVIKDHCEKVNIRV